MINTIIYWNVISLDSFKLTIIKYYIYLSIR